MKRNQPLPFIWKSVLLVLMILVGSLARAKPVAGFKVAPLDPIHESITGLGLLFLYDDVYEDIAEEHIYVDANFAFNPEYHFDDCEFHQSSANINSLYNALLAELNPVAPDYSQAADYFGQLLHPIQDFYAHTNWIEMGRSGQLVDNNFSLWPAFTPFNSYQGVVVIQGETIPQEISLTPNGKLITVNVNSPINNLVPGVYPGLVSGSVYLTDECINSVTITHENLNKDDGSRSGFTDAYATALKQTTHEWCRLVYLTDKAYGQEGVKGLFDNWVNPFASGQREATCNGIDIALIIDATGSMDWNDPNAMRLEAAKALIDATLPGTRVTVISFNTYANTRASLQMIGTSLDKESLKNAVNLIGSYGSTNLNSGLQAGFDELQTTTKIYDKAAIFLTDGDQTSGTYLPQSHLQFADEGWPIYTVGLGASTNPTLLAQIAGDTGGTYSALDDPQNLVSLYQDILQDLLGSRSILNMLFTLNQGETQTTPVALPLGQTSATFFASWPANTNLDSSNNELDFTLTSPDGSLYDTSTVSSNVYYAKGTVYAIFVIQNPESGVWQAHVNGASLVSPTEVNLEVSAIGVAPIYLPTITR